LLSKRRTSRATHRVKGDPCVRCFPSRTLPWASAPSALLAATQSLHGRLRLIGAVRGGRTRLRLALRRHRSSSGRDCHGACDALPIGDNVMGGQRGGMRTGARWEWRRIRCKRSRWGSQCRGHERRQHARCRRWMCHGRRRSLGPVV
jgi:hypothetical protein